MIVERELSRGQKEKKPKGEGIGSRQGEKLLETLHSREKTKRKRTEDDNREREEKRQRRKQREKRDTIRLENCFRFSLFLFQTSTQPCLI